MTGCVARTALPTRGLRYFLWVFGAGFAFGLVRVPLLVPRIGERSAELLEMAPMLAVIVLAARRIVMRPAPPLRPTHALTAGLLALALLLAAELLVAALVSGGGVAAYLASRDPVSGGVYLAMLALYAVMPALIAWRAARRSEAATEASTEASTEAPAEAPAEADATQAARAAGGPGR